MAKIRAATKTAMKMQLSSRLARGRIAFLLSNTGGNWDNLSDADKKRWADKGCMNHDFGKKLEVNAAFGKFAEPWDNIVHRFYGGREEPMFPPVPESKQVIEYDYVSAYPPSLLKKLPPILA